MGTGSPFPGGTARPGRDADHLPHLVKRLRMSTSFNLCLCGQASVLARACLYFCVGRITCSEPWPRENPRGVDTGSGAEKGEFLLSGGLDGYY
jgi:hypothetical protein